MKILLLNPNSSELVTDTLRQAVEPLQTTMLHIDVKHCNNTPKGIVSCFDELKASVEVIDFLLEAEADYDGAIIGCFADPGLRAARETIRIPVTGLYESSSVFAKLQGRRYSIIASGNEADISPDWKHPGFGRYGAGGFYSIHELHSGRCRACIR